MSRTIRNTATEPRAKRAKRQAPAYRRHTIPSVTRAMLRALASLATMNGDSR